MTLVYWFVRHGNGLKHNFNIDRLTWDLWCFTWLKNSHIHTMIIILPLAMCSSNCACVKRHAFARCTPTSHIQHWTEECFNIWNSILLTAHNTSPRSFQPQLNNNNINTATSQINDHSFMRPTYYRRIEPQTQSVKEGSTDDRLLLECELRIKCISQKKRMVCVYILKSPFLVHMVESCQPKVATSSGKFARYKYASAHNV